MSASYTAFLRGVRHRGGAEDAAAQRAESLASVGDPRVDSAIVSAVARHVVAEVLELLDDWHRAPARQLHVRQVGAVVGGGVLVRARRRRAEEHLRLGGLARHAHVHLHAPVGKVLEQQRRLK